MRKTLVLLVATIALLAACKTSKGPKAPPPTAAAPVDASALADHLGDSVETAVTVPQSAAADEGAVFENRWIYGRYGKFRRRFSGLVAENGRHYDEIKVELFDHSERTVYFDITDVYGASLSHTGQ